MKVLIINAILYTNEDRRVKKVDSIKDCMICDLCKAFVKKGHDVTLIAAEDYKPTSDEKYPFNIIWMKSYLKNIFPANKIPFNYGIKNHLKNNNYDLIISSEVFSIDTLLAVKYSPDNLIIWQEMAFHQRMAKQLASKFWHNVFVKHMYKGVRIVPRTDNAKRFIEKYSDNVSDTIIQHGIDLKKFTLETNKNNSFIVSSQLIKRKRIDKILHAFSNFCVKTNENYILNIAGDGECRAELEALSKSLNIDDKVRFLGKLPHASLVKYLSKAKGMLIYTEKDNSMISIAESIAVGTPVITTSVPDNSRYINENGLGLVRDNWGSNELELLIENNEQYIDNCIKYRNFLDDTYNVELFVKESAKQG